MTQTIDIKIPDIGDFSDVEIIEIHVGAGDSVKAEDALISLESDKATMDVPSPQTGVIQGITVAVGETVSEGSVIGTITVADETDSDKPATQNDEATQTASASPSEAAPEEASPPVSAQTIAADLNTEVVVIGSGPGGYTAAFRAADLGKSVTLIERYPTLGGVCLNVGCIPSKALLHAAKVIAESKDMAAHGVKFSAPEIDIDQLRGWKDKIIKQLTGGLAGLSKQRKVNVVQGTARFLNSHQLEINDGGDAKTLQFKQAIIAVGSEVINVPGFPTDDARIFDSTGALALRQIPKRLLVIGGGIIGLEMATVYHELGAKVTIVELMDQLIPGADSDIVKPLHKRIQKSYENIFLKTKVVSLSPDTNGINVTLEGAKAPAQDVFDQVLVSVGRRPNGLNIDAHNAGVAVSDRGFIAVDDQQRTNIDHIFAIGDVVGQPMLAHKAVHEGKVAAEVAAGLKSGFDARVIPSVAYTDPEVAWVGMTENEAKKTETQYGKGVFPWAASGRSLSLGRNEGITKVLFDERNDRIIGAGIVGPNAGDLIAEAALAIEMGSDAQDIGLTIHPHPTLSETIGFAAEAFEGTITDLYMPKKPRK